MSADIDGLLDRDTDKLYELLGRTTMAGAVGALGLSPKEFLEAGKRWLDGRLDSLKSRVCASRPLRTFVEGKESAEASKHIVAAIALAIAVLIEDTHDELAAEAAIAGVLLARMGVRSLCEGCWREQDDRGDIKC